MTTTDAPLVITDTPATGTDRSPSVVHGILERIRTMGRVEAVFGEPVERDGVTLLPAASVRGGGGGGGGGGQSAGDRATGDSATEAADESSGYGEGGGFGLTVRPVGAFVIKDGRVWWQPALDWTRLALAGDAVLVTLLVTRWWTKRARARAAIAHSKEQS